MNHFDPFNQGIQLLKDLEDESSQEGDELNRRLVNSLFVLMRSSWLYGLDNDTLKKAQENFCHVLSSFESREHGLISLTQRDESFSINDEFVKLDFSTYQNVDKLTRIFEALGFNRLSIPLPISIDKLRPFCTAMNSIANQGGDFRELHESCLPIVVEHIERTEDDLGESQTDPRREVMALYASGLEILQSFVDDLRRGIRPHYSRLKRLCLRIIQSEPKYQNLLLALIHVYGLKNRLATHMLNTALLSIIFARRIGLSKNEVLDLGMTAFYQNLAWVIYGRLDEGAGDFMSLQEIEKFRIENQESIGEIRNRVAHLLLMIGGFNSRLINRLIVAYETQVVDTVTHDLYRGNLDLNLLTDIVKISGSYNFLVTPDPDGSEPRPEQIMKKITRQNTAVHPFIAQIFESVFGTYPIGTLVELSDGALGVVFDLPANLQQSARPRVKLVADRTGQPIRGGDIIDLSEKDPRGGYSLSIENAHESSSFAHSPARFFFGAETLLPGNVR